MKAMCAGREAGGAGFGDGGKAMARRTSSSSRVCVQADAGSIPFYHFALACDMQVRNKLQKLNTRMSPRESLKEQTCDEHVHI